MNNESIKNIALSNGFKLKQQPNGEMELNPYVYDFAKSLNEELLKENAELQVDLSTLTIRNEALTHLIAECTEHGELDPRLFGPYIEYFLNEKNNLRGESK